MQTAALLWHAYELTESGTALAILAAAEWVPIVLVSLWAGDLADRFSRSRLLQFSQAAQLFPALALGWITLEGNASITVLVLTAFLGAIGQAMDAPARKTLAVELVGPNDLPRVLSAMDLIKNGAKLVGPVMMGFLTVYGGIESVYFLNGLSFIAMIAACHRLGQTPVPLPSDRGEKWVARIRTAGREIRKSEVLRGLLVLDFGITFTAGAEVLLPMVAKSTLGLGADGYGILASGIALGALVAGGILAWRPPTVDVGRTLRLSAFGFAISTIGFGLATEPWLAFLSLGLLGAADTVNTVLRNTWLQLSIPNSLRGRITALSSLVTKSGPRLGQVEAGLVAAAIGAAGSIILGGVLAGLWTAWVFRSHPKLLASTMRTHH